MTKTQRIPLPTIKAYASKMEISLWHAERELKRRKYLERGICKVQDAIRMLTTHNPNRAQARMLKPNG